MKHLDVKTLWKDKVAIRDKYIDELKKSQEDLQINLQGKKMTVMFDDLEKRIAFRSPRPFYDKFSKKSHYLYYFNWVEDRPKMPDDPQQLKLA